jgi:hypothetical protein
MKMIKHSEQNPSDWREGVRTLVWSEIQMGPTIY